MTLLKRTVTCFVAVWALLASGRLAAYTLPASTNEPPSIFLERVDDRSAAIVCYGVRHSFYEIHGDRLVPETRDGSRGEVKGGVATVRCRDFCGKPARLTFRNGQLVSLSRAGDATDRARDEKLLALKYQPGLKVQWPKDADVRTEKDNRDYFVAMGAGKRLALWYANPNAAGALFAELALVFFAVFVLVSCQRGETPRQRRRGILPRLIGGLAALLACGASLWFLSRTGSRGAALAFLAGAVSVVGFAFVRKGERKTVWISFGLLAALTVAAALGVFGTRLGSHLFSMSWSNLERLRIWSEVPRMLAAAPFGWGVDESGAAYCDWFQPLETRHPIVWLVNSHCTWLVERGVVFGFFYCAAWLAAFAATGALALKTCRRGVVAFAMLVTWFVLLWFSTLGGEWTLWIIPVLTLVPLVWRVPFSRRVAWVSAGAGAAGAVLLILVVVGCGKMPHLRGDGGDACSVSHRGGLTTVGEGEPEICLVPDPQVCGRFGALGRDVRRAWCAPEGRRTTGSLAIARTLECVPQRPLKRLILFGRSCAAYLERFGEEESLPEAEELVFVSPPFAPAEVPDELTERLTAYYGEFSCALQKKSFESVPGWCRIVTGAGLYWPEWTTLIADIVSMADAAGRRVYVDAASCRVKLDVCGGCGTILLQTDDAQPVAADDPGFFWSQGEAETNVVDILIVYDKTAKVWASQNAVGYKTFAKKAVADLNEGLAQTGLDALFKFRLAGVYAVSCSMQGLNPGTAAMEMSGMLSMTKAYKSAYKAIRKKRDAVKADVVAVLVDGLRRGYRGASIGFDGTYFSASGLDKMKEHAYCMCDISSVVDCYTLLHEIGHIFGAGHSDTAAKETTAGPQLFEYSSGHRFTAGGVGYTSVMGSMLGQSNDDIRLPFFSTPDYTLLLEGAGGSCYDSGVAVGDATHDNTLTISRTFPWVANFRVKKALPEIPTDPYWITLAVSNGAARVESGASFTCRQLTKQVYFVAVASGADATVAASGLPSGLAYSSATGLISGYPKTAGTYSITVTATNVKKRSASCAFTLTVEAVKTATCPKKKSVTVTAANAGSGLSGSDKLTFAFTKVGSVACSGKIGGVAVSTTLKLTQDHIGFTAAGTRYDYWTGTLNLKNPKYKRTFVFRIKVTASGKYASVTVPTIK